MILSFFFKKKVMTNDVMDYVSIYMNLFCYINLYEIKLVHVVLFTNNTY